MGPFHCLNGSLDYSNILLLQISSVALPFFLSFFKSVCEIFGQDFLGYVSLSMTSVYL